MAQFRYRLQPLLEQKVRVKEEAQLGLAAAQRELRAEEAELGACRRAQEVAAERLAGVRAEGVPGAGVSRGELLRLRRDYLARLQDECDDASDAAGAQELRVSDALERVETAREVLTSASREVEVLEKYRARLERRFHNEIARKEAAEQEEMASLMFQQGRKP
jgi:flagellar export protein FliJ